MLFVLPPIAARPGVNSLESLHNIKQNPAFPVIIAATLLLFDNVIVPFNQLLEMVFGKITLNMHYI